MNETRHIAILGAGNMGTALAQALARTGGRVVLWDHFAEVVDDINRARSNRRYLPGVALHEGIRAEGRCEDAVRGAQLVVLAVPSPFLRGALQQALPALEADAVVLSVAKGIDPATREPVHRVIAAQLGGRPLALLAGPAIANEFARGLPTAVVLAAEPVAIAERLRPLFAGDVFRVATTADVSGAALGGILKNIYAILLGYLDATSGGGRNLEAAALNASLREMSVLAVALGAERDTIYGLAGLGDLVATGFSDDSHNRKFGRRLGEGETAEAMRAAGQLLPEGACAVDLACAWAGERNIALPLAGFVRQLVAGGRPPLKELLDHLC